MSIYYELGLVVGLIGVASHPSPYFAAFGLVWAAGAGCFVLKGEGASFLSLVLFLVYLGGMMVVFAYSSALVAEPHPEAWTSFRVVIYVVSYIVLMEIWFLIGGGIEGVKISYKSDMYGDDWFGVSTFYTCGGWLLLAVGWGLLLTLFSVLEVVRGRHVGILKTV